ncbi:hypothetical protein PENSPDRAFT_223349 [Peniophora sp. CONT]|nr:hypothetical protein PENSPDRAFT_223349 [Peniophora sp. CONT]
MAQVFPSSSKLDVERTTLPSRLRMPAAGTSAEASSAASITTRGRKTPSDASSLSNGQPGPSLSVSTKDLGQGREPSTFPSVSHINWLLPEASSSDPSLARFPASASASSLNAASSPTSPLRQSASLSDLPSSNRARAPLKGILKQPSTRSLQMSSGPVYTQQLSPIYEAHSSMRTTTAEPSTPASLVSNYSAFLHRPIKRSTSQASSTTIPSPIQPSQSHTQVMSFDGPGSRAGRLYERSSSEGSGSFITAPSALQTPVRVAPMPSVLTADELGQFVDISHPQEVHLRTPPSSASLTGRTLTNEPVFDVPSIGLHPPTPGPGSSTLYIPIAVSAPRMEHQTSGDTFIWRRWANSLSISSAPRPTSTRRQWPTWLPEPPKLLFWVGFVMPPCWMIGGWLLDTGRFDVKPAPPKLPPGTTLPLWRVNGQLLDSAGNEVKLKPRRSFFGLGSKKGKGKDEAKKWETEAWHQRWASYVAKSSGEKSLAHSLIDLKTPGPQVWVLRCRIAAIVSGSLLLDL